MLPNLQTPHAVCPQAGPPTSEHPRYQAHGQATHAQRLMLATLQGVHWRVGNISRDAASPPTWLIENALARECCSRSWLCCRGWQETLLIYGFRAWAALA